MVGSGLIKLAKENNFIVAHGVAYGVYRGYVLTFSEGAGWKKLVISTCFVQNEARETFRQYVAQQHENMKKGFRVSQLDVLDKRIEVSFADAPGTMSCIRNFMDWFLSILEQAGACKSNICPECGMPLTGGRWKLVGNVAMYIHEGCGQRLREQHQIIAQTRGQAGSYGKGALGAFLGATAGAVVWMLVMLLGYVTSLVGLLIGFLAEKGYSLLGGKTGRGKLAILLLAVVFGVLLGTFSFEVADVMRTFDGISLGDCVELVIELLCESSQARAGVLKNTLLGLFFAALGVIGLVIRTKQEVSLPKYIDLD